MIHYSNHPPNVKDYCELRVKAGMSPKSEAHKRITSCMF